MDVFVVDVFFAEGVCVVIVVLLVCGVDGVGVDSREDVVVSVVVVHCIGVDDVVFKVDGSKAGVVACMRVKVIVVGTMLVNSMEAVLLHIVEFAKVVGRDDVGFGE